MAQIQTMDESILNKWKQFYINIYKHLCKLPRKGSRRCSEKEEFISKGEN